MNETEYLRWSYYGRGMTMAEIGEEMAISRQGVSYLFGKCDIPVNGTRLERLMGDELEAWLFDCLERGLSLTQIAGLVGCSGITGAQVDHAIRGLDMQVKQIRLNHRFWSKVGLTVAPGECWEWQGSRDLNGYGRFLFEGKITLAHRFSWELLNGPVPPGLCVLHACDNPCCCNTFDGHLFLGSRADNVADMRSKERGVGQSNQGGRANGRDRHSRKSVEITQ